MIDRGLGVLGNLGRSLGILLLAAAATRRYIDTPAVATLEG